MTLCEPSLLDVKLVSQSVLDIFRDSLAGHGMLDQWRDFLRASGKLQALCYKEEIEVAIWIAWGPRLSRCRDALL
jgi:hypothetical protein